MVKRWRQLTVWLHVLTSVGWMAQAMALCLLLGTALAAGSTSGRDVATGLALALDGRLLAPMADASAFTGVMLAAATPWGFFRHWWVTIKFVITLIQLVIGIFVLSPALNQAAVAGPSPVQVAGGALMAATIAFQGWLSIAKPFGRVRSGQRPASTVGPRWVFVVTVLGGLADLVLAFVIGHPMPLLSLVLIVVVLARRGRSLAPGEASEDRRQHVQH